MNSKQIKDYAYNIGADLCNIADIKHFTDAPKGYHPKDVYPSCKSVIVFACSFAGATLDCNSQIPYTIVRNILSAKMDKMAVSLCMHLQNYGIGAVPTGTISPTEIDPNTERTRSIVSAKHAAQLAGMGKIGKNTLLITPEYGNMVWLSLILTDYEFTADPVLDFSPCPENCRLCIDSCPVGALNTSEMDQQACWNYAFGEKKGAWQLKCCNCRRVCPNCFGTKNKRFIHKNP